MADIWSKKKRSEVMARIRSKNTKPEMIVRSLLHSQGYRFRIHRKDLPGCPDITLPKYRSIINVFGCFWHQHENCIDCSKPKTNAKWWKEKLANNVRRDKQNSRKLKELEWRELIVWECETNNLTKLSNRLNRFLARK